MSQKLFEDYAKAIYSICNESETAKATTGAVARRIGVTAGTACTMIRNLAEAGLVELTSHEGATLTQTGRLLALRVVRRHRLVALMLSQVLHLEWAEVCAEAEQLEHAISEKLADRIDDFLGQPAVDPLGVAIPRRDGSFLELRDCSTLRAN